MTRKEVSGYLAIAATVWPNREVAPNLVEIWFAIFREVDVEKFGRAFDRVLKTSAFFPVPALVQEILDEEVRQALPSASEAWELALGYARRRDLSGLRHSYPLIGAAVDVAGTWSLLTRLTAAYDPYGRNGFGVESADAERGFEWFSRAYAKALLKPSAVQPETFGAPALPPQSREEAKRLVGNLGKALSGGSR